MSRTITVIIQIGLMQLLLVIYSYAQANIEHPQEKYIPYLDKIEERVISLLPKNNSGQSIIKSKIHNAKQIYQIGQKECPSYQIIGRITSIVTDQENNIYLLDSRKNTVLVYNSIGKYLYQFGRGGRGPGEFQSPIDMAIDEEGNIYVADRFYLIHKFENQNGRYTHKIDIQINVIPDEFCIMKKRIYVRGLKAERNEGQSYNTIHAYQLSDGEHLFSFGESYQTENIMVKKQLSDGKIACDSSSETVMSTFDMMPYIFGYTGLGNIKWISKIEPFQTRPVIEKFGATGPSITFESTEYPTNDIEKIHATTDGNIIVQVSHSPRGRNIDIKDLKIISLFIDSDTGIKLDNLKLNSPLLFFGKERFYVNGFLNYQYPTVLAYEL